MSDVELGVVDEKNDSKRDSVEVLSALDLSGKHNSPKSRLDSSDENNENKAVLDLPVIPTSPLRGSTPVDKDVETLAFRSYLESPLEKSAPLAAAEDLDDALATNKKTETHLGIDDGLLEDVDRHENDDKESTLEGVTIDSRIGEDDGNHSGTDQADHHGEGEGLLHAGGKDHVDGYILVRGRGDGATRTNGIVHDDRPFPETFTIAETDDVNVNVYQQKKNLAQGMMDLALLSANANQLRYVLESPDHAYYPYALAGISISIILQIAVGVGLILNSRYDVNKHDHICKADKINNFTVLGIFLVTIVNVFITSFGPTTTIVVASTNT